MSSGSGRRSLGATTHTGGAVRVRVATGLAKVHARPMELLLIIAVAALLAAAAAYWTWDRRKRGRSGGGSWTAPARPGAALATDGQVVLDAVPVDPEDEAVQRLAGALARDALAADALLAEVTVVDANGRALLTLARPSRLDTITIPEAAPELMPRRGRAPSVVERPTSAARTPAPSDGPMEDVHRDLASRFQLPERVAAELRDREDPVDLVRAIMVVGGREVSVDHNVLRSGDDAIVVVGDGHGHGLTRDDLSGAFLKFKNSGARRGLIVAMGFISRAELARREALAPEVSYVGAAALQRMADAASIGVDPLRFAKVAPS